MKSKTQPDKLPHKVTIEGSLGLLAMGDIGLRAWREVKKSNKKDSSHEEK